MYIYIYREREGKRFKGCVCDRERDEIQGMCV